MAGNAPKMIVYLFWTLLKVLSKLRLHFVMPEHFKISNLAYLLFDKSWKKITRLFDTIYCTLLIAINFGHRNLSSTLQCIWHEIFYLVSCSWISIENGFKALKVLEECKKKFFAFKIRAIWIQIYPGDWNLVYRRWSCSWRHIVYLCHIWCCSEATSFPGSLFTASLGRWKKDPGCGWSRDNLWNKLFHRGRVNQ